MLNDVKKNADQKMQKSVEALKANLGKIRTGRAHTGLLDHVMVEYYGSMVAVNQVANVSLGDARTINVQAYEKNMIAKVEKAIRDSDLGLNPATNGDVIRVPMPRADQGGQIGRRGCQGLRAQRTPRRQRCLEEAGQGQGNQRG